MQKAIVLQTRCCYSFGHKRALSNDAIRLSVPSLCLACPYGPFWATVHIRAMVNNYRTLIGSPGWLGSRVVSVLDWGAVARYLLLSFLAFCPFDCYKPVYRNDCRNRVGFWHGGLFPHIAIQYDTIRDAIYRALKNRHKSAYSTAWNQQLKEREKKKNIQ